MFTGSNTNIQHSNIFDTGFAQTPLNSSKSSKTQISSSNIPNTNYLKIHQMYQYENQIQNEIEFQSKLENLHHRMSQFENIDQINISKNDNFSNFMAKYQPKNYPPNLSSNKINDNSSLLSDKTYLENDEKIEKGYEQYLNKTGLEKIIKQSNPNPSNKENYPMTNEASSNYIKNENKQSSVNKLIDIKRQVDMFLQPDNESSWQNERLDFIKLQHKYKGIHWECLMENRIEALRVLSIVLYNN